MNSGDPNTQFPKTFENQNFNIYDMRVRRNEFKERKKERKKERENLILFLISAVRSFVRNCIISGHYPYGIHNGVEGLVNGDIDPLSWESVNGWAPAGGAYLGTKRTLPHGHFEAIAKQLREKKINGLFMIGGFEVLSLLSLLYMGDFS